MNSSKNNLTSVISFVSLLLSQPRSMLAIVAAASWLIISLSFFLSQPDQNEKAALNDPNSLIAKFWQEYGWQYHDNSLQSVHFVNDQHGWAVGDNGAILATQNGGKNWRQQANNTTVWLNSVHFANDQLGWAVGGNGVILTTQDGGKNWRQQASNTIVWLEAVHFVNNQLGWAVGDNGVILTTQDGGKNWRRQESNTEAWLRSVHFVNDQLGWAVGDNGVILTTQDGGKNWHRQENNTGTWLRSVHFVNDQLGWAVGDNETILATQNGGKNWRRQENNTGAWLNSVYFVNNQLGWAVGGSGTILTTQDGGINWVAARFAEANLPSWYWGISILCAVVFLSGLLGIRTPSRSDAISAMLSSDRPRRGNESDALESKKLAWALSRFLRHQRTEPPLTIAVNAPWGGGKSSLMNWLREDLERFGFRPVWFNAWHYEKQEQMFPALLETIRQQAIPTWLSWQGIKFRGWLLWHRIKEHPALTVLLFILACFPAGYFFTNHSTAWTSIKTQAVLSLEQAFPRHKPSTTVDTTGAIIKSTVDRIQPPKPRNKPDKVQESAWSKLSIRGTGDINKSDTIKSSQLPESESKPDKEQGNVPDTLILLLGLFPGLAPLIGLLKGLQSFNTSGDWLGRWLNPTEQSKATRETAYRAQFARDFHAVTSALDHTLVIFIDDLDRCQPKSVCEVMETVNFLSSEGSCYMVLGVWREGVERAIGLGFAEAAKEFAQINRLQTGKDHQTEADDQNNNNDQDDAEIRRRYGQLYLEKLINIWVSVPILETTAAQNLLKREQSPQQLISATTLATSKGIPLHSRLTAWRDQLWVLCKRYYATARKLSSLETWRGLRWVSRVSLFWRFLAYLISIYILGAFFFVIIISSSQYFDDTETIINLYSELISYIQQKAGFPGIFLLLLLHGLTLIGLYLGIRFAILRRLPTKPLSRIWFSNLLIIATIMIIGIHVFQFGQDWSKSPEIHQHNSSGNQFLVPDFMANTSDTAHFDTTSVSDPDKEITVSTHENPTLVAATIVNEDEFHWLMWIVLGICALIWIEWLRFRLDLPDDSPAFEESLLFWSPVLTKRFDTPRRLKRFINHLRFNAMRLRTLQKPDSTQWEQFWNRHIRGEKLDSVREDEMQGKESGLLLLSVLDACCGADFKIKSMLVSADSTGDGNKAGKSFQSNWEERLKIDAQLVAEYGKVWESELHKLLIERLKYFESNTMPQPTLADLHQFEALAPARITPASVRFAGLSEQAAWDQKTERRSHPNRRSTSFDISRFVADRRSGLDRRMQQASVSSDSC